MLNIKDNTASISLIRSNEILKDRMSGKVVRMDEYNNSIINTQGDSTAYESIIAVISDKGTNSQNTITSYAQAIRDFIKQVYNKELECVTWSELTNVTYTMAVEFREYLSGLKRVGSEKHLRYSPRSINQKIFALSSIFKELSKINNDINIDAFDLTPYKFDTEEGSYGSLTESEIGKLFEYCLDLPNFQKPIVKQLFFETAYVTAIRSGALMKMTWKDLKIKKDTIDDVYYNVIRVMDKGDNVEVPINDDLYDRLMAMKEDNLKLDATEERVFPITRVTLSKCLKDFCISEGISEDRNIVLHSLKKSSIDKVYRETGDINATARHGHHKGLEMVYRHYQGKNDGLANAPSLTVFDEDERDLGVLEDMSKEELLRLIGKCNGNVISAILREVGKK